jgi:AcrR family transcriptional regulator
MPDNEIKLNTQTADHRRPLRGRERKARRSARPDILRVFARLVAEQGYSETSIANVADELTLSKGTIAFHFGSKEALLRSLIDSYMRRRLDEAYFICSRLSVPTEQLCGMIYALLAINRDDRDSTHTFLREFIRFKDRSANAGLRELRGSYFALVHEIVRRGMLFGDFRKDDSRMVTLQIFGMCNYAWTWLRVDGERSIEDIAETFCNTIISGLRATPAAADELNIHDVMVKVIDVVLAAPDRSL